MRANGNDLEDDDGTVLGTFLSHWGACAAMLGDERYAVTCWDDRLQTVVPVGKLHPSKAAAQAYAESLHDYHDLRLVPERDIPVDARGYFK
jgi:hypothetical protein